MSFEGMIRLLTSAATEFRVFKQALGEPSPHSNGKCHRANLEVEEFRPDARGVAMQPGDGPRQGEARFASVAGIEKKCWADLFAKRFVRMTEHDDIGQLAFETVAQRCGA